MPIRSLAQTRSDPPIPCPFYPQPGRAELRLRFLRTGSPGMPAAPGPVRCFP